MSNCDVCIGGDFDGDGSEFFEITEPKARKPHKCYECGIMINPGDRYERVAGKWEGEFATFETCLFCVEVRKVFSCGESVSYGELWDSMIEAAFPRLTTASPCFCNLSADSKQKLLHKWNRWKFKGQIHET